jgi:hypothetical protein
VVFFCFYTIIFSGERYPIKINKSGLPMNKTFTHENLLLLAFGDHDDSIQERTTIDMIRDDKVLYEEFLEMKNLNQMIENSFDSPSDSVINTILSYSKSLAVVNVPDKELRLMIQN